MSAEQSPLENARRPSRRLAQQIGLPAALSHHPMSRILTVASLVFALLSSAMAWHLIAQDRSETLQRVSERTASMARMIIAHGDAAADNAEQIIDHLRDEIAKVDIHDPSQLARLAEHLRDATDSGAIASAVAVLDERGRVLLDSNGQLLPGTDVSDRKFFKDHVAHIEEPVIRGDNDTPLRPNGPQFTYSRSVRNPDGSLHAVVVVTVPASAFDTLYKEAANWTGARAGLYTLSGDALARVRTLARATPAFIEEISRRVTSAPSGTDLITVEPEPRIVSWNRSARHPMLFATSSQPVSDALEQWRSRAWTVGLFWAAANAAFLAFVFYAFRANEARQRAAANEIAVREVSHRLKNSLQMIVSLLRLRGRKHEDPKVQEAITDITNNLIAVAEAHRLVHSAATLETVDLVETLKGLCSHLHQTYGTVIDCPSEAPVLIDAAHASTLSVIANELATNAIKHGKPPVAVTCSVEGETLHLAVTNSGGALPEGFDPESTTGFGLRAVRAMLTALANSRLTAGNLEGGGVAFTVIVPMRVLEPRPRNKPAGLR
ncbi:MAG: histidine kinase dimerization/phosphoacceptor domain -containing protein [Hyphomicrobiales bacterium]